MLELIITKRTDTRLLDRMSRHYSQPKGFVGRNICYAVLYAGIYYGHIVAGSATRFLPGRHEYLGTSLAELNYIINNIFFSIERVDGKYPIRNFLPLVIGKWRERAVVDWYEKYGDRVAGFETLVELPRTGVCYVRDGWEIVGVTKGYTCKRVSSNSELKGNRDSWTGKRVWNTTDLKPKLVLVRCAG